MSRARWLIRQCPLTLALKRMAAAGMRRYNIVWGWREPASAAVRCRTLSESADGPTRLRRMGDRPHVSQVALTWQAATHTSSGAEGRGHSVGIRLLGSTQSPSPRWRWETTAVGATSHVRWLSCPPSLAPPPPPGKQRHNFPAGVGGPRQREEVRGGGAGRVHGCGERAAAHAHGQAGRALHSRVPHQRVHGPGEGSTRPVVYWVTVVACHQRMPAVSTPTATQSHGNNSGCLGG